MRHHTAGMVLIFSYNRLAEGRMEAGGRGEVYIPGLFMDGQSYSGIRGYTDMGRGEGIHP